MKGVQRKPSQKYGFQYSDSTTLHSKRGMQVVGFFFLPEKPNAAMSDYDRSFKTFPFITSLQREKRFLVHPHHSRMLSSQLDTALFHCAYFSSQALEI